VRNPILGKVKTRIAKDLGDDIALDIYKKLLAHTHTITKRLKVDRYIFYADFIIDNDLWQGGNYYKQLQSGSDLGERMHKAFHLLFNQGYNKVAIIGSDCFDLTTAIIEEAFESLESNDTVVGPTFDGGYYLIGSGTLIQGVFHNKTWSTDSVFSDTIKSINEAGYNYYLLPKLSDVDNGEDCKKYPPLFSPTH
jgi:hypothetical protein